MTSGVGVTIEERDGVPVVVLRGEIDIANATEVRNRILAGMSNVLPGLVLDLSTLTYLDSRGVQLILELAERMKIRHLRFRVVMPDRSVVKRILLLTHVDQVVPLDETVEEALRHVRAAARGPGSLEAGPPWAARGGARPERPDSSVDSV